MAGQASLDPKLRLLAAAMRRWPRGMRKLDYWWENTYRAIGGGGFDEDAATDLVWPEGLQPPVRCSEPACLLPLGLQDWAERRTYFSGRYYQRDILALLKALIRQGDRFVDIGANIGMITLIAARAVGPSGRVDSFEVNPDAFARLRDNVLLNRLDARVRLHAFGLGAEAGEAVLTVAGRRTGVGTLTAPDANGLKVEVRRLDDSLADADSGPIIVKLDVEGFEQRVLAGAGQLLGHPQAAFLIEISPEWLTRVGDSAEGLYATMRAAGLYGLRFALETGRWRTRLHMRASPEAESGPQYDALFVRPGSTCEARLRERGLLPGS